MASAKKILLTILKYTLLFGLAGLLVFLAFRKVDWKAFYEARCRWMDSHSVLGAHSNACKAAGKANGLTPEKYCAGIDPREIAHFRWEGGEITAIRCARAPKYKSVSVNRYHGYAAMVFGNIFQEPEEASCLTRGRWLLIGAPEALEAFRGTVPGGASLGRKVKYAVVGQGFRLVCNEKETVLNLYK